MVRLQTYLFTVSASHVTPVKLAPAIMQERCLLCPSGVERSRYHLVAQMSLDVTAEQSSAKHSGQLGARGSFVSKAISHLPYHKEPFEARSCH